MSQIKLVVQSSLKAKGVDPSIIDDVDTFLYRSVLRLQKKSVLPPRLHEFLVKNEKQEKRVGKDKYANFIYMPKDFGKVHDFQVFGRPVYHWKGNEYDVLNKGTDPRSYFTIVSEEDNKLLFINPFPSDDETVRIKYHTNGKVDGYDWISEEYWEAIISDIETMLGIDDPMNAETQMTNAIGHWREPESESAPNKMGQRVKSSYFGNRRRKR